MRDSLGSGGTAMDTPQDIPRQFRIIRNRALIAGGIPCAVGAAIAFASASLGRAFGLLTIEVFMIGFGVFGIGVLSLAFLYRCPNCHEPILEASAMFGASFDLTAEKCPHCGTSFRNQGPTAA